jgi:multiple sugar transport system ATP-binding protein
MRVEISRLHHEIAGSTMIYVTHDQTEAMTMGDRIVVLKDGIVQQVADPMTLYESPVNKFVAGFIGSPSMNFIEGKLTGEKGLSVDEGTFQAEIPNEMGEALNSYAGKEVVFGVRPESVKLAAESENGALFKAKVEVVEPMGNETIVYVTTGNSPIVARLVTREEIEPESEIELSIDMRRVHFFDPSDEKTIV